MTVWPGASAGAEGRRSPASEPFLGSRDALEGLGGGTEVEFLERPTFRSSLSGTFAIRVGRRGRRGWRSRATPRARWWDVGAPGIGDLLRRARRALHGPRHEAAFNPPSGRPKSGSRPGRTAEHSGARGPHPSGRSSAPTSVSLPKPASVDSASSITPTLATIIERKLPQTKSVRPVTAPLFSTRSCSWPS